MSLNTICSDVSYTIASYLTLSELSLLSTVSKTTKSLFSTKRNWKRVISISHPYLLQLCIETDSSISIPIELCYWSIQESELKQEIRSSSWSLLNYTHGDAIVRSYITSIVSDILRVKKLNTILERLGLTLDWRIAMNKCIDELLKYTEEEKEDLVFYITFKDRNLSKLKTSYSHSNIS